MLNRVQATFVESLIMKIVIFKVKQCSIAMSNVDSVYRHGDISVLWYSIIYYVFYVAHYHFNPVEISAHTFLP